MSDAVKLGIAQPPKASGMSENFDVDVTVIQAKQPGEFVTRVKDLLSQGGWRVVQTEMSVTDNQYDAMLIRSIQPKGERDE